MNDKRKILSDALLHLCKSKSLDAVTVTEITLKAKVTRQIFYRYFSDKYDLAKYIHLQDYYSALDSLEEDEARGIVMWAKVSRLWFEVIQKNAKFYQNIYRSNSGGEFKRIMRSYITNFYLEIVHRQLADEERPDLMFVIQLYLAGVTEKINEWIEGGAKYPVDELHQLLYMAMPEAIRGIILFNEMDKKTAKEIAISVYPNPPFLLSGK